MKFAVLFISKTFFEFSVKIRSAWTFYPSIIRKKSEPIEADERQRESNEEGGPKDQA